MMSSVYSFRVWPQSRRGLYFNVVVYVSRASWRRTCRRGRRVLHRHAVGQVRGPFGAVSGRPKWAGDVELVLGFADTVTVAHECFHATMLYARRTRTLPALETGYVVRDPVEEELAEVHGQLCQQIAAGLVRVFEKRQERKGTHA
jgi:hypothetical protein